MPLNLTVGETAFPLDAALITSQSGAARQQIRHAADPLLQKLTDYLTAVLNSENQSALTAIREQLPNTMQVIVKTAIPAAPEQFAQVIKREDMPILCVYRTDGTWTDESVDKQVKSTLWIADYVMPELEALDLGSLLGLRNAVVDAMALALKTGRHSAYNSGEHIAADLDRDITPGPFSFGNWETIDREQAIMYPSARLSFTTIEGVEPNNNSGTDVPLKIMDTTIGLPKDDPEQDDLSEFVETHVEFLLVESVTTSGTDLYVELSKDFDETALPDIAGWRLSGTDATITGYGDHEQPVLTLELSEAITEIGEAKLYLVRYGDPLTAADGLGSIETIPLTLIEEAE